MNIKSLVWKSKLKLSGDVTKNLSLLKKWEWLNNEEFRLLHEDRMRNLLLHAYNHVPYYRAILKNAGVIDDDNIINLNYFSRIPFLTKDILRNRLTELKSNDFEKRNCYENSSGGSTGEPVKFLQDKFYEEWSRASSMLCDIWTECYPGDRKVILWGSERDLFVGNEPLRIRFGRCLRNEMWLNSFKMTPEQMNLYVKKINEFKPVQILAYVESIYEFSRFIEAEKLKVYSPKAIVTSAGTLYPHMRDKIQKVFNSNVFNQYGSREVGCIACECNQHKGLHANMATQYVEIFNKDGTFASPGEIGEIAVTSLTNYSMPIIRYKIGDLAAWAIKECDCGRQWPVLAEVSGRMTDTFVRSDGGVVSPEYFIHLIGVILNCDLIKKFQVIQEDYLNIRILIVPNIKIKNIDQQYSAVLNEITNKVQIVMGKNCDVNYDFVNEILPSRSGKFGYIISKVNK